MVVLGLGWSVLPSAVAEERDEALLGRRGALVAQRALFAMRRATSRLHPRAEALLELATAVNETHEERKAR
jgi:hypothetical protein